MTSAFLFGNGLSIALSKEFSIRNITEKFFNRLDGIEKKFLIDLCSENKKLNFEDFEEQFSQIESALNNLAKYRKFIESPAGKSFLQKFNISNPSLEKHEAVISKLYDQYIIMILDLIQSKVTLKGIEENLGGFVSFLKNHIDSSNKSYVFTLNYDLLAETILLENIGTERFTDYCTNTGKLKHTQVDKFDFDPALSDDLYENRVFDAELLHLHGSMSLFIDEKRNKAVKFRNEDVLQNAIYDNVKNLGLRPAIITGGGKNTKIQEYPFEFYFRKFKDLSTYGKYQKLFIVGYSFRDEHVNDNIRRWARGVEDYSEGLLIIDYKKNKKDQEAFKKFVRKQIKKRPMIPDECFEFGGVNAIRDVVGASIKKKKK